MKNNHLSRKVAEFILTRHNEALAGLGEDEIARTFGINKSRFSREFRKEYNMSVDQFILRERLYRAFFFIEKNRGGSELSGTKVSEKLGFRQYQNFASEFKNYFLIEPDRFIHLNRTGKDAFLDKI